MARLARPEAGCDPSWTGRPASLVMSTARADAGPARGSRRSPDVLRRGIMRATLRPHRRAPIPPKARAGPRPVADRLDRDRDRRCSALAGRPCQPPAPWPPRPRPQASAPVPGPAAVRTCTARSRRGGGRRSSSSSTCLSESMDRPPIPHRRRRGTVLRSGAVLSAKRDRNAASLHALVSDPPSRDLCDARNGRTRSLPCGSPGRPSPS